MIVGKDIFLESQEQDSFFSVLHPFIFIFYNVNLILME